MRQAYLPAPGEPLALREVPVGEPGPRQALVRVEVATVCTLTDLGICAGCHPPHDVAVLGMLPHELRAEWARDPDPLRDWYPARGFAGEPFPAPMGHEAGGTIVALGPGANDPEALVFDDRPVAVGDRVATFKVPGAYSEYARLSTDNVLTLPDWMSMDEASLFEPFIINLNCLRRCWSIQPARTVAVLGQGCQGLIATQVARALGAERVIVSEPLAHRRALALELGADDAIDPARENVVDAVLERTGWLGADLVVECAGAEDTIRAAPYMIRRGGMLGQIGAYAKPVTFDYGYVHFRHFIVVPTDFFVTLRAKREQVRQAVDLLESGQVRLEPMLTHRFPLERINEAFDLVRSGEDGVVKVAIDVAPQGA